jgi:formate dehydrogenase iron-sulfur subunit
VATCPTDALVFGERAELLKEAHARIAAHPGRYVDHVYGETENGGTSYLIVSHVPFKELGLPELGPTPLKDISELIMGGTLPFALGLTAVLSGVAAGVHVYNKNKASKKEPSEVEEVPAKAEAAK